MKLSSGDKYSNGIVHANLSGPEVLAEERKGSSGGTALYFDSVPIAVVDIPDDPRTPWVRKGDSGEELLDATTKRHYTENAVYEWDESKHEANLEKHGLDFMDAGLVYESELKLTMASKKGGSETRFVDYALVGNMLLALIYTVRYEAVRVISFRPAHRNERRAYHAAIENR